MYARPRQPESRVGCTSVRPKNVAATSGMGMQLASLVGGAERSQAVGDTTGWDQFYASPDEVYVWRAPIGGARIDNVDDAQLLVRAIGRASTLKLDIRGVVFGDYADGEPGVDVVMTADTTIPYAVPQSASLLGERAMADPSLRQRFPHLSFGTAQHGRPRFLELTGPPDAVDFWLQHPIVWDDQVGPVEAFVKQRGIYGGEADDGPRLREWTKPGSGLEPGNGNGGEPSSNGAVGSAIKWGVVALVGAAIVWAGARAYEERAA